MTGRFILSSGYGIQVESADDPFVSLSETWIKTISHATQRGGYLGMLHTLLKGFYLSACLSGLCSDS